MNKKLTLIVLEEKTKRNYVEQLCEFFDDKIDLQALSLDLDPIDRVMESDLFLISLPEAAMQIASYLPANARISYVSRTFDSEKADQLNDFEDGTCVMVFDHKQKYALETMAVLNQVGYGNLHFIASSLEDMPPTPLKPTAAVIVSSEIPVPPYIRNIIVIGWYKISVLTYADIIEKLGIQDETLNRRLYEFSKKLKMTNSGLSGLYQHMWRLRNQWEMIIDMLDNGIILTDAGNNTLFMNARASALLDGIEENCQITKAFLPLSEGLTLDDKSFQNRLFRLKNTEKHIIISKRPVFIYDELQGYLFLLQDTNEIQKIEHKIRLGQNRKGFKAKYTFDHIITQDPKMKKWIEISKKVALTSCTVLITGESGVGKELFAQSIHNYSGRKTMPFVAVNCAALPASLLESELFGYEEGAFTGAKKGGKKGLFEIAHQGTLFLDEIGEMPVQLQANLLRALQEKEIMRLGGDSIIPIDVRIIAASNADFSRLMEEKKFRLDLYYRLKTMSIHIPCLNERSEDIPLLCRHYLRETNKEAGLPQIDAFLMDALKRIKWQGNVRELNSCLDYMLIMGGEHLTTYDLPLEYQEKLSAGLGRPTDSVSNEILRLLKHGPMGRRSLTRAIQDQGYPVSEYRIRKIMTQLEDEGKIKIGTNKKGSCIIIREI